jgi:hypothetical protein
VRGEGRRAGDDTDTLAARDSYIMLRKRDAGVIQGEKVSSKWGEKVSSHKGMVRKPSLNKG